MDRKLVLLILSLARVMDQRFPGFNEEWGKEMTASTNAFKDLDDETLAKALGLIADNSSTQQETIDRLTAERDEWKARYEASRAETDEAWAAASENREK